jgi:DNA polymerase-3 subunit gamma/tau
MDAASNTSVNDIREIIENCRYKPISARYKVYIIDEVHMLSNSAFNALLKTLEEPPAHVKFIFATTETRKIPLTILSRCQRFDLKRVKTQDLVSHFEDVLNKEGFTAHNDALKIIANASGGSVRDGLSILEQAISNTDGNLSQEAVRSILGLTERDMIFDIYANMVKNQLSESLKICAEALLKGFDPIVIAQDFMDMTHNLSKAIIDPSFISQLDEAEATAVDAIKQYVDNLKLARIWGLLLKGVDDIKYAFNANQALEMLIIRLAHLSSMPSPEELIRKLKDKSDSTQKHEPISAPSGPQSQKQMQNIERHVISQPQANQAETVSKSGSTINSTSDLLKCLYDADEMILHHHVKTDMKIIKIEHGKIALSTLPTAPQNISLILKEFLEKSTFSKWSIVSSESSSGNTVAQDEAIHEQNHKIEVSKSPEVKEILNSFTGLGIADIKLQKVS